MVDIGTLNPEQMLQQQQILRQQKMAEMLMQQPAPQGQMIGNRYVAPSFTQNLANLANMYVGQQGIKKAEQAQLDLAKQLRQQGIQDTERLMNVFGGRPEVAGTPDVPTETYETVRGTPAQPAIAPNPRLAFAEAINMQSPQARALLPQIAAEAFKKPEAFILPEGAKRFVTMPDGSTKEIATGGDKTSPEYANYLLAAKDPINPFKGGFTDYQTMLKKAGATSINMPSGEERKAGFMSTILDRNILQMQNALGVDPKAVKPNVAASVVESVTGPNLLSRSMKPAQRQIVEDSQLDVLDAALTLRTGAAYTREQLNAMRDTYFPVLGDKPAAITEKKQRLESLLDGAYIAAGRATPPRVSAPPPAAPPALPPVKVGRFPPPPAGVPQNAWNVMTPQERALWQ